MITEYVVPALYLLGLVIIYFTTKNLLPSYFGEKGKNLATKQDISQITKLVESVKHDFNIETEKLKSKLNIQVGLIAEERNAIIDFNEKYYKWLNILIDSEFGYIDIDSNIELDLYNRKVNQYYIEMCNSESKLNLFATNSELIDSGLKLKIETMKVLSSVLHKTLIKVKFNNKSNELNENYKDLDNYFQQNAKLSDERSEIFQNFHKEKNEKYETIAPLIIRFQEICKTHLYKILENN